MTNIGDWVQYTRQEYVGYSLGVYKQVAGHAIYKPVTEAWLVVGIEDGYAMLDRWHVPQITRRTKVFGHYVDRTPYRELWAINVAVADCKPIPASVAKALAAKNDGIMKLPTRAERDNARQKRRNARKVN